MTFKTTLKTQLIEELKAHVLMTNQLQTVVNVTVDRVCEEEFRTMQNDIKKAEEHKTSKDFYKYHLKNLLNELLNGERK